MVITWCVLVTQVREDDSGEPLKRGTRVTLHLKEDAYELADEKKLQDLIKQYSEFIQFPIRHDSVAKLPLLGFMLRPRWSQHAQLA